MKLHLLLVFLFLSVTGTFSQTSTVPRFLVDDVVILTGFTAEASLPVNMVDFQKLAPGSDLLKGDYSDFQSYNSSSNPFGGSFSVLAGMRFRQSDGENYRLNPRLRLGISYISSNMFSNTYNKITRTPYDTLTSSATGDMIFVDSINNQYLNMDYRYRQLRLDVSLIFATNPASRWSLYGGVGLSSGLSVNSSTDISFSEYDETDRDFNDYNRRYRDDAYVSESFQNETSFSTMVYMPLGVDFRLGKERVFWRQLHLCYELRPMVHFTNIPELGGFSNVGIQSMFGLRVRWNEI